MGTCPGQAHKAAGCFALAILLWACLGGCALASDWRWQGDNGLQLDDNAGLASDGTRQRRTAIVSQRLNGQRPLLRAPHHAVDSAIGLHLAQALRYPGLSHLDAQLGLGWRWQPGAGFHATQWGLELRGGARWSVDPHAMAGSPNSRRARSNSSRHGCAVSGGSTAGGKRPKPRRSAQACINCHCSWTGYTTRAKSSICV